MIIAGLTGNIGSGKSTVARVFETLGIAVFRADEYGRRALEKPAVTGMITARYGPEIMTGLQIDRKKLAGIVFSDPDELKRLNAIIHPEVKAEFSAWLKRQQAPYILHEAAILFESGFNRMMDKVIFVDCPEDIAFERVMKRDGITLEEVRKRASFQWAAERKAGLADFVIINDGRQALLPQVIEVHSKLTR
ncbi:MAG: dephospho-CoA kinase [Bacteroidales bacterium]|nr:dephospho-CoA kinase [Bacteroidales bacterium]